MIGLFSAGASLQQQLDARGWQFCFIGGVANYRWGTPRLTNDLDLTLLTGFGSEESFAEALLDQFESRVPEPRAFAVQNRVLLLVTDGGIGIDIALGAMPFEIMTVARASEGILAPGISLRTCSADDLVVHKAFAARAQDWVDVEGVILRQRGKLAWERIWSDLRELAELKGEPEILDLLKGVIARAERTIGPFPH